LRNRFCQIRQIDGRARDLEVFRCYVPAQVR
jgi:hypothetical protein